jgi:hypothetical protein
LPSATRVAACREKPCEFVTSGYVRRAARATNASEAEGGVAALGMFFELGDNVLRECGAAVLVLKVRLEGVEMSADDPLE